MYCVDAGREYEDDETAPVADLTSYISTIAENMAIYASKSLNSADNITVQILLLVKGTVGREREAWLLSKVKESGGEDESRTGEEKEGWAGVARGLGNAAVVSVFDPITSAAQSNGNHNNGYGKRVSAPIKIPGSVPAKEVPDASESISPSKLIREMDELLLGQVEEPFGNGAGVKAQSVQQSNTSVKSPLAASKSNGSALAKEKDSNEDDLMSFLLNDDNF